MYCGINLLSIEMVSWTKSDGTVIVNDDPKKKLDWLSYKLDYKLGIVDGYILEAKN